MSENLKEKQHGSSLLFSTALPQNPLFTLRQFNFFFVSIFFLTNIRTLQLSKSVVFLYMICILLCYELNCQAVIWYVPRSS